MNNKFWIVVTMLLSVNLIILDIVNADDTLVNVEIFKGINPQKTWNIPGTLDIPHKWQFEKQQYSTLMAIDVHRYNTISRQNKNRRYNQDLFPLMVYEGEETLKKLIIEFNKIIPNTWTAERKVNFVLAFVQAIPYKDDKTTGYDEYYKHPIETLAEGKGDCEDSSILFAAILRGLGFQSALIILPGHLAVGVKGDFQVKVGWYIPDENDKYYYCETTGIGWKLGMMPEKYEDIKVGVMPIKPNPVEPKRVIPQNIPPTPNNPPPSSPQISLQNGINLYYKARYNEAIKSMQLALSGLSDPKQRAKAYIYLGMAEYTYPGVSRSDAVARAKARFEQALRENPEQEIKHSKFQVWFKEVHEGSIGKLTASASPSQTAVWISGNGIDKKKLGYGTIRSIKLFKGNYTVEGVYAGRSKKQTIEIKPRSERKLTIKISVDTQPPKIVLQDPPRTAKVDQLITIKAKVTDNTAIGSVYLLYDFTRSYNLQPSEYGQKTLMQSDSTTYTGYIPPQSGTGYIWYYVTATDQAGNEGETENRVLEIKPKTVPLPYNQPPKIELVDPPQTANVNQLIAIMAKITDDKSVESVNFFYSFSQYSRSKPVRYVSGTSMKNHSDIYSGYIPSQKEAGYIWYYFTATDREGKKNRSVPKKITIQKTHTPGDGETEQGPPPIIKHSKPIIHQGIWINYAWSSNLFKDNSPIFDWNRGDAISFAYLREGRTHQTFAAQLDYSYQNPANLNAAFQWGPALGKSPIVFTLLGGVTGYSNPNETIYITPILGASLKCYPLDRVSIETIGSLKLPSHFDTTYLYHYEIGTCVYITDSLNLKLGYSQFHFGGENHKRMQIGLGFTF